jgi:hypothetical protein
MQLTLAFLEQTDHPPSSSAAAWEQLDEAARRAALEGLAHLIARMLAPEPATEASDE